MDQWLEHLSQAIDQRRLVSIDRKPLDKDYLDGYVVGMSNRFLLLHVRHDNMYLDGYAVVRTKHVRRYRVYNDQDDRDLFVHQALQLRGMAPIPQPHIELTTMRDVLESANELFPLITIHQELIDNGVCYIGRVSEMMRKGFKLQEIDTGAEWTRERKYKFSDITKVDFGGGYEEALMLVSEHRLSENGDQ